MAKRTNVSVEVAECAQQERLGAARQERAQHKDDEEVARHAGGQLRADVLADRHKVRQRKLRTPVRVRLQKVLHLLARRRQLLLAQRQAVQVVVQQQDGGKQLAAAGIDTRRSDSRCAKQARPTQPRLSMLPLPSTSHVLNASSQNLRKRLLLVNEFSEALAFAARRSPGVCGVRGGCVARGSSSEKQRSSRLRLHVRRQRRQLVASERAPSAARCGSLRRAGPSARQATRVEAAADAAWLTSARVRRPDARREG